MEKYSLNVGEKITVTAVSLKDGTSETVNAIITEFEQLKGHCNIRIEYESKPLPQNEKICWPPDTYCWPYHWDGEYYTVSTWGFYAFDIKKKNDE